MITQKDKDAAVKTLTMSLLIFVFSTFAVFGQAKTPEESAIGRALSGGYSRQQETSKPTD